MKAQFVFEKFEEHSDPINDMGIGLQGLYDNLKPGMIVQLKKDIDNFGYFAGDYFVIYKVTNTRDFGEDDNQRVWITRYTSLENLLAKEESQNIGGGWGWSFNFFKEYFKYIGTKRNYKFI